MITLKDIEKAHDRIRPFIHRTPILTNSSLNELSGAELFFKCENFQKAGSFKIRGATNAVQLLSEEDLKKGIGATKLLVIPMFPQYSESTIASGIDALAK